MSESRRQRDLLNSLAARQFFADKLEAHFRAHPLQWISILDLMKIGGPSWRSRIVNDLRQKRGLNVPWNHDNRASAYRFIPWVQLGRSADVQPPDQPALFEMGGR